MSAMRSTSRRDFLKKCLTGAAVLHASGRVGLLAAAEQEAALAKSRVVIAHDAMLRGTGATCGFAPDAEPSGSRHAGSLRP